MDQPGHRSPSADALYEHAACGLVVTEDDGTIVRANATFCSWIGHSAEALAGKRLSDLLTIGGKLFHQTHWHPLLQMQGSVAEVKLDLVRDDGQTLPMMLNAVRRLHDGQVRHELAFFVATDRDKYERELLHARRQLNALNEKLSAADRRKDEFLATLAHELRNPLAPVRNVVQILRQQPLSDERFDWSLDVLERQVRHLSRLVDDLLDVSRIAQGKIELRKSRLELIGIVRASAESVRALLETAGLELRVTLPAQPLWVDADETRLAQIIQNLLNNAAKFTPKGGRVALSVERQGDAALLSVRDSGIGIAPEHLATIFDMFAQVDAQRDRAHDGLGIGLALVRALTQMHGGTVSAESAGLGQGSTFTVRLPLAAGDAPAGGG